ncbi:ras-related protein Rab-8A-like isoform X2 [Limulus polyphemus]|uniref:Ras-related protein Rab-8A-like isoform X2 n=1 Tax=Limulus polyphemus TaxID=6850 RepID=A0ABM1SNA2_LIMPO|nr:ras-related protein Rab-8A-like isoform X2 [Limulus polyphemus]
MAVDFTATYKMLVLGDSNVGKTCIVNRFCDEKFYDTYISTIGIDFKQKIINLDGMPVKLQIWDTAGQERFRTLTTAYYRGAMNASPDLVKVLVGNKCDVTHLRQIERERGEKLADSFNIPFFECSCKQNINVQETFLALARLVRQERERRASKLDELERQQWEKGQLNTLEQNTTGNYRCSC